MAVLQRPFWIMLQHLQTLLPGWSNEEVGPPPTHPGCASIRDRRAAQGKGGSTDTSLVIEESGQLLFVGHVLRR